MTACASTANETAQVQLPSAPTPATQGDASPTAASMPSPFDCVDPEFTVVRPLFGRGFNPKKGLLGDPQEHYTVHTTQFMVTPDQVDEFRAFVEVVKPQLEATEGLLAYASAMEPNCGFDRTLAIWTDTESMYKFVFAHPHVEAMAEAASFSTTGKVAHWSVTPDELPVTWEQAMKKLDAVPVSGIYR